MYNGACLTHFTLFIIHYTLNPAVGVQLGLGEQPFFIGYA